MLKGHLVPDVHYGCFENEDSFETPGMDCPVAVISRKRDTELHRGDNLKNLH